MRHAGIKKSSVVRVKLEFKFLGSDRLMIIALRFSNFLVNVEGRAACDIAHECISRRIGVNESSDSRVSSTV